MKKLLVLIQILLIKNIFSLTKDEERVCDPYDKIANLSNSTRPELIPVCKLPFDISPVKIFFGCFTLKRCIIPHGKKAKPGEADCIENANCHHLIAYGSETNEDNRQDEFVIELFAKTSGSISIGLANSEDSKSYYLIECLNDFSAGISIIEVHNYWFENGVIEELGDMDNIRVKQTLRSASSIYCKIYMKRHFSRTFKGKDHVFDLVDNEYCINVISHDPDAKVKHHNYTYQCRQFERIGRHFQPTENEILDFTYHGVLMIFTWMFFIPVANFVAGHYKAAYSGEILSARKWLLIHFAIIVIGALPLAGGIYLHIDSHLEWESISERNQFHLYGGYFSHATWIFNFFLGFCIRPRLDGKWSYFAIIHVFLGHITTVVNALLIAKSPNLPFTTVPCLVGHMAISWIIVYVILNILMSFQIYWCSFITQEIEMPSETELRDILTDSKRNSLNSNALPADTSTQTRSLFIFMFISFLFAISTSIIVIFPPEEPCYTGESQEFFSIGSIAHKVTK